LELVKFDMDKNEFFMLPKPNYSSIDSISLMGDGILSNCMFVTFGLGNGAQKWVQMFDIGKKKKILEKKIFEQKNKKFYRE
jgi:hypothetical protein